ncbi:MAG: type II secretion system F family protein [Bryobacteraceae bacterium]|nr:type II secretion system F family protein [Bryobacteraceae bacterium]
MLLLFFFAATLVLGTLVWAGAQLFENREDPLAERLEDLQSAAMANTTRTARRRSGGGFSNGVLYAVSLVPGGEDYLDDTERELKQAGIRNRRALAIYVLFNVLFFLSLVGLFLYLGRENPITSRFGGLVAAGLLGYLLPKQILHRLVKRYRQKLQEALPDTVDLLGIVLGTGLSIDQAMLRVSEEMRFIYPELAAEFGTVVMQVKAGQERTKAFNQLVRRTGIEDIKSLAAMIVQSEKFGTSLSQALKVYADSLRNRRRLRAEEAIAKAGIKMLFPIILFILPVLFAITLGPAVLTFLGGASGIGQR